MRDTRQRWTSEEGDPGAKPSLVPNSDFHHRASSEPDAPGTFFRGCLIWVAVLVPIWAFAIWKIFF